MPFEATYITELRTISIVWDENFDAETEGDQIEHEGYALWEANGKVSPVFLMIDTTAVSINMGDVMTLANVARLRPQQHPDFHEAIPYDVIVTTNRLINLAAKGMQSATFGNIPIRTFPTRDAAIKFIEDNL